VAPAHHTEPLLVDVGQRLEVLDGAHRVVDLVAPIVDRVVELLAVAGAPAILGTDDHVAALDRFLHEGEHADAPVAVDAAVHPDHRGMAGRTALVQRLEHVRGYFHVADAAPVRDLLEVHHALAGLGISRLGVLAIIDVAFEVVVDRVILGAVADVEAP
jgi:hypothetical protein